MKKKEQKKPNIISRWYKLCKPSKAIWIGQILTFTIYTIFLTVITIFAARTIDCMYNGDWHGALLNLFIEVATIVLRNAALIAEYKLYGMQHVVIRKNIGKQIYQKLLSCESAGIKRVSKEKIVNIATNNMDNAAEFPEAVAGFLAYSIQVILTLILVFSANVMAGVIVMLLGVFNFFVYYKVNKKLGHQLQRRHEFKDDMYKSFSKVIDGKTVIAELKGSKKYEKEVLTDVENFSKEYAKYYDTYAIKNNLNYAFWNVIVYIVTAFLLYYVSQGTLDIAIYLIIVPYLKTCTEKLNTLFDKTSAIENMRVDVDRVNIILEMNDKQLIKYGKFNTVAEGYNLGLIDVTCKQDDGAGEIVNADISFKQGCLNLIKGEKGSGKRVIFNLLRRYIKPEKGKVLLDNLDLYYYNEKTFKNHIDYCASHPEFITKGSIRENLILKEKRFKKVKEVCKQVGISSYIEKLPKKYNTEVSEIKSKSMLFLLGLARAVLSNSKILMIYEFPEDATKMLKTNVFNFLKKHYQGKTVIVFSHSNDYDELAEITYEINNGRVKQTKIKKPENKKAE